MNPNTSSWLPPMGAGVATLMPDAPQTTLMPTFTSDIGSV